MSDPLPSGRSGTLETWIGLVDVRPAAGTDILGGSKGAHVNALALASSRESYEVAVTVALHRMDLLAVEFEQVELFSVRSDGFELGVALLDLAEQVRRSGEVCFGDFYAYDNFDA